MDKLTKEQRHKNMQAIRSKDTKIEILLRKALWHEGIRYRKNYKVCSCHPDIVITKYKIAVFCDGEFWHGKSMEHYDVTTNVKYWHEKSGVMWSVTLKIPSNCAIMVGLCYALGNGNKKHLADCVAEVQRCIYARRSAVKRK